MKKIQHNKDLAYKISIIIVFVIMLYFPLIQDIFSIFPNNELKNENRVLAEKPKVDITYLDGFPEDYNEYYNDHFAFRSLFINLDFMSNLMQKKSPISNIIIGENYFLFSGWKEASLYQGNDECNIQTLKQLGNIIVERTQKFRKLNIESYYVIIPTTLEIYSEYLPNYLIRTDSTSTDKFNNIMKSHPEVNFIYLKDFLLSKKSEGQLYRRNDNHWNQLAAYYSSDTILKIIKRDFPDIPIYNKSDYQFDTLKTKNGNLSEMLMTNDINKLLIQEDVIYETHLKDSTKSAVVGKKHGYPIPKGFSYPHKYEEVRIIDSTNLPKLLIIRDSYATDIMPFLSNSFSK